MLAAASSVRIQVKIETEFSSVAHIPYAKLLDPVSDIITLMESLLTGAFGPTTGDQRECYKRIHAYSWGLHTLVMDVITALGLENAATRPAVLERFNALVHPAKTTLDNLAAGFDGDLTDEQTEVIDVVLESVLAIEHMMSNLWQYSQLKHNMLTYVSRNFDGAVLLRKLRSTLTTASMSALRRDFRIIGDETCLTYAFGELAHNIRQHAGVDRIGLRIQDYGYRCDIAIFDRGAGFAKSSADDAFRPFWQSDAGNPGLGLGLYLAKQFIEGSGGRITINSEPGRGALVKVRLNSEP